MRNIISSVFLGCFLVLSVVLNAADKIEQSFSDIITHRFTNQFVYAPNEKVYLQTDKPYYSAGEDLWFKGYLVNATTNEPTALSQYLYVELIDKSDSVCYRVKIKRDSLGFSGHLKLKAEQPSGTYALRAYTLWMQNVDNSFFFSKNIMIGNAIDDNVNPVITYGTPSDGLIPVTLTFTDASHNPISGKRVGIEQKWNGSLDKKMYLVTNQSGMLNWKIAVDSKDNSKKSIGISMDDLKYKNTFYLPAFSTDFDVQFFPESGVLLNNDLQSLAFKAIGKDGLSQEVTGRIFTDKNEEVSKFSTTYKGMGKFALQTQPNESYYALVKNPDGIEKRFELPKTEAEAVAIHLRYSRNRILYEIVNQTSIPTESLYLLVHSRGKVFVVQPFEKLGGQILESLLPPGIVSFSVIDTLGHTFCERLSFIRNNSFPEIAMESNKPSYGKRELVDLSLNVHSAFEEQVSGNFSVSITDSHIVKLDSRADNIQSYLLLSSDIKGYIEDPAGYFVDNKTDTREKTDVLMMTQGWRRFNTSDIVKAVYKAPVYPLEEGQALSGKVLTLFNKPSKKKSVIMFSSYNNLMRTTETDSLGRYQIDRIEFPDSTSFALKAIKSGMSDIEIDPNPEEFPKPYMFIPTPWNPNASAMNDYLKQSKEKYFTDGGMRVVNLSEVTVKGFKEPESKKYYYSGKANSGLTSEQLEKFPNVDMLSILRTIPGIEIHGDIIIIRGTIKSPFHETGKPLLLVDGIEYKDIEDISYLRSNDVENIEIFRGTSATVFGSKGIDGAIAITMKVFNRRIATPVSSIAYIVPLGYQRPAQFYVPTYEVSRVLNSSLPDLRTTIYWNPKLVADSNGVVHIKFYTADNANDYNIVMEGITNGGEQCRYVGVVKRSDK
jgi:hypothetical protein